MIKTNKGQALIEYVLLTVLAALIFGYVFGMIRSSAFKLWMCDITIKVMGPTPCKEPSDCLPLIPNTPDNFKSRLKEIGCSNL